MVCLVKLYVKKSLFWFSKDTVNTCTTYLASSCCCYVSSYIVSAREVYDRKIHKDKVKLGCVWVDLYQHGKLNVFAYAQPRHAYVSLLPSYSYYLLHSSGFGGFTEQRKEGKG